MQFSHTERLHELISERFEVVQNLYDLTQAHAAALSGDELAVTMSILARKECLVDRLRQIHGSLETYQNESPESRSWQDDDHRQQTRRLADQSDDMLRKILELDGQTLRTMQDQRDAVAAQLRHGHDSTSAQEAYSAEQNLGQGLLDISEI
jgi:hypothetical protein